MKQKQNEEERHIARMGELIEKMKEGHPNTFWEPRMKELLPFYLEYIRTYPNDAEYVLMAYAWDAWKYALQQR